MMILKYIQHNILLVNVTKANTCQHKLILQQSTCLGVIDTWPWLEKAKLDLPIFCFLFVFLFCLIFFSWSIQPYDSKGSFQN